MPVNETTAQKEIDTAKWAAPFWVLYEHFQMWRRRATGSLTFHYKDGQTTQSETRAVRRREDIVSG